ARGKEGPQVVDRVGLGRVLVRTVALDAREAQSDTARIARRGLDAVQRYFDDELRPHEDGDPAAARLAREQLSRLPLEELVREPFEALPDHDEVTGARVAGAEVEVREPPLTPAVAPLGSEHHQVVRADGLHLAP